MHLIFNEKLKEVIIDVGAAQFWDVTSVAALETVINKLKNRGAAVQVIGINHGSEKIIRKYNNSIDNRMSLSA
jgi:SulP family sulfate permease